MRNVYGLILSGGSGTRLWPLSRENFPKQFITLYGDKTLLQATILRMMSMIPLEFLRVISGARWHDLVMTQAGEIAGVENLPEGFVIEEPCARGTAPAIMLAADDLMRRGAGMDDVMIVVPSDAFIRNTRAFTGSLKAGIAAADDGYIATLGIAPVRPETGFGYIRKGREIRGGYYEAEAFVEKPDLRTAEEYLAYGNYLWNGGIFIFTPRSLLRELERADGELFAAMKGDLRGNFAAVKNISFDNAVMEKAEHVAVVPMADSGWSDVGSWDALHDDVMTCDENGNAVAGDAVILGGHNCFVHSPGKMTVLNMVDDIVVVDTPDALFITRRGMSQEVRQAVKYLKDNGMTGLV
ncbi:MAG: mannose-1-phosphate guanylyltransferase [Synergistaceae bacterium]|nr:mannose-1-phosphate guanylyltransferase [Synergistaceae bacterium]